MNFSDARTNFKRVADQVVEDHAATLIHRRDAEDIVLISASDYSAMQETMYLLSSKANAVRLMDAMAEADRSLPPGARILEPQGADMSGIGHPSVRLAAAKGNKRKPAAAGYGKRIAEDPAKYSLEKTAAGRAAKRSAGGGKQAKTPVKTTKSASKAKRKA